MSIAAGLSYFPANGIRDVVKQLDGAITALEWTADLSGTAAITQQDVDMLTRHAHGGTLVGHGVHYSVLSAGGEQYRRAWLDKFNNCPWRRYYQHFSVHFGFSTAWKMAEGAPLPVPFTTEALNVGRKNLESLARYLTCPIGLENLALAFSRQEVEEQGRFIDALLMPFDGFVLLDLHNLYCQSVNFSADFMELVKSYPLQRVREIHLSGGSWDGSIRRDTHNGAVPQDILDYLPDVMALCPNLRCVFLEQLPDAACLPVEIEQIKDDFNKMKRKVDHAVAMAISAQKITA